MNRMKFILVTLFIGIIINSLFGQLTVKDPEQDMKLDKAIQNVRDSLRMVFQEDLNRKLDSLKTIFQKKQDKFVDKFQQRNKVNYEYIQNLEDSINALRARVERYKMRNSIRDSSFENRYYKYIDNLLDYKDKERTNILGLKFGGREINKYKINDLKSYLRKYSPYGKSIYIRYYLTQVYNNQKDYVNTEYSFLKFLYSYADRQSYNELKHSLLEIIFNTKYFKDRSSYIVKIMDNVDEQADFETRYYHFIKELENYPKKEVKNKFTDEVDTYLLYFGNSAKSAQLLYDLYKYYKTEGKVQYAFLTLKKINRLFPDYPESDSALFNQAEIRFDKFKEYNKALSDYNRFIEENPDSKMAPRAQFRIARIFENYLQKYDMAFQEYQELIQHYPGPKYVVKALNSSAEIAENKLKERNEAISLYLRIANDYPNLEISTKARAKAAELYYNAEEYQKAVDQFVTLYREAPMDKKSIKYIKRAAKIYENQLHDIDKAIEALTYIEENFPETKEAEKAREEIEELSQKSRNKQ